MKLRFWFTTLCSLLACGEDPGLRVRVESAPEAVLAFQSVVREVQISSEPCARTAPLEGAIAAEFRCATTARIDQANQVFVPISLTRYEQLEVFVLAYEERSPTAAPTLTGCAIADPPPDEQAATVTVSLAAVTPPTVLLPADLSSCAIEPR